MYLKKQVDSGEHFTKFNVAIAAQMLILRVPSSGI
jgi:hypothetical protein